MFNLYPVILSGASLIPSQDSGFIILFGISNVQPYKVDLLVKMDSSGNVQWAKEIDKNLHSPQLGPVGIAEAKDRSIYVVNQDYDKGVHIQKLDKNATPLWSSFVVTDTIQNIFTRYEALCATSDNGLIISTYTSEIFGSRYYSHLLKFSAEGLANWKYSAKKNSITSSGYLRSINTRDNSRITCFISRTAVINTWY